MSTSATSKPIRPKKPVSRDSVNDIARGLSILTILMVHCIVILTHPGTGRPLDEPAFEVARIISTFIMPAFYFISGLSALGLASRSMKKVTISALRFLLLAWVTQLMAAPLLLVTHPELHGLGLLTKLARPFYEGKDFILVVTWFFVSMAGVQILAWLYLRKSLWIKLGVVALCLGAYLITALTGKTVFMMHTWAIALLFFMAGREYARRPAIDLKPLVAAFASITGFGALMLTYSLNRGCAFSPTQTCEFQGGYPRFFIDVVNGQFGFVPYLVLSSVIGIIALMTLSMLLNRTALREPLARIGRHTLVLLMINGVFVTLAPVLLKPIIPTLPDTWLLSIGFTAVQVAIYPFLSRPINNLLHMCTNWADSFMSVVIKTAPKPVQALLSK